LTQPLTKSPKRLYSVGRKGDHGRRGQGKKKGESLSRRPGEKITKRRGGTILPARNVNRRKKEVPKTRGRAETGRKGKSKSICPSRKKVCAKRAATRPPGSRVEEKGLYLGALSCNSSSRKRVIGVASLGQLSVAEGAWSLKLTIKKYQKKVKYTMHPTLKMGEIFLSCFRISGGEMRTGGDIGDERLTIFFLFSRKKGEGLSCPLKGR